MKHALLAASALVLASCTSTTPTDSATPAASAAPAPATATADIAAGQHVYQTYCVACHGGGDETAPVLDTLHTLGRERVSVALSPDGLMAVPAGMIDETQIGRASCRERVCT